MARRAVKSGGYLTSEGRGGILELSSLLEDPDNVMNPGTTADLIAAGLFVFLEGELERTSLPELIDRWDVRA
jgi:triphosphoribosyl-dephospho-CoA synthetase